MARVGQNPMKWMDKAHHPQNVTATTIVHIPVMEGYWQDNLEVLKLCLHSMRSSTSVPFDLMVFDNGSCETVVDYLVGLQKAGFIQYLILSDTNLGKVGAWNMLFQAAPGDIISFCDSDVYFLDGWLEESIKILENFPKAGIVSAKPIAGGDLSISRTAQMASVDPDVEMTTGILIPEEYVIACVRSLGKGKEEFERRQIDRKDVLLSSKGVEAYSTASHFQFTTKKEIVSRIFPVKSGLPLRNDTQFDNEMVDLGYWRLSTKSYLAHHMGNKVPDLVEEIPWIDPTTKIGSIESNEKESKPIPITHGFARKLLKKVNAITYELLYGKDSNS